MENNSGNCPLKVCKKIYKAVAVSPAFQTIRRISHRPITPASRLTAPTPLPVKTIEIQIKENDSPKLGAKKPKSSETAEMIPVKFDHHPIAKPKSSDLLPIQKNNQEAKAKAKSPQFNKDERKKSGVHIEDSVTDFISRGKNNIRTTSNVGERRNVHIGEGETAAPGNDPFLEYINHTRGKMRTTSSFGGGKSVS